MRLILFPIWLILSILIAFLRFLLNIAKFLLYLLMIFCIFSAIIAFFQSEVYLGISALIVAFLISPYGLPMIGEYIIAFIEAINSIIKEI